VGSGANAPEDRGQEKLEEQALALFVNLASVADMMQVDAPWDQIKIL
jgi:hypothetical protein